jgi:uncharacterized protein (TIGR00730 family)
MDTNNMSEERVALITKEFTEGFEFLKNYPRSVSIFGSTRAEKGDLYYGRAFTLAERIVRELKYSIITGGSSGIMEAANRGAYEAGGNSIGLLIELESGQPTNKYLTASIGFHHFFVRKVCLAFSAEAYIFYPGGFGTLDEFSEILTLVQTRKIKQVPIVLVGIDYWAPLVDFFKKKMLAGNKIEKEDLSLFVLTDDNDQIIEAIKNTPVVFGVPNK